VTPEQLLAAARELVRRPDAALVGLWPRAAALAARRALEDALDQLWAVRAPGLERASARAQLACLPQYLRPPGLAGEVAYTWTALSAACHHHAYDLGPTATELEARFDVVERFLARVADARQ
jgi:hypothetical protein